MMLIISSGEFSFIFLFSFGIHFFLFFFPFFRVCPILAGREHFQWVRNSEGRLIKVSVLQESYVELNISLNLMRHLEEGQ